MAQVAIHPGTKRRPGYNPEEWKKGVQFPCKPCWELKYCPYGPLVEQAPLLPSTREQVIEHIEYLKDVLRSGLLNGSPIDPYLREIFEQEIAESEEEQNVGDNPDLIADMQCNVFGHICPVVLAAEGLTETTEARRRGSHIPFAIKMRVVRRDNHTCRQCGKHLPDDEVEFDHIIPIAEGGSSDESNIRLTCFDCSREKSVRVAL